MIAGISRSTIFKYLDLALSLDINELKKKCLEFYVDRSDDLGETDEWIALTNAYPQLNRDIFMAMQERIRELRQQNAMLKSGAYRVSHKYHGPPQSRSSNAFRCANVNQAELPPSDHR